MKRWLVAFSMMTLAGCTGASAVHDPAPHASQPPPAKSPPSPTPTDVAPTSTASSIEQAVSMAVDGFDRSTITVNDPPDPEHPDLPRYRAGSVLQAGIDAVTSNRNLGIAFRMAPGASLRHEARVVQLTDVRAIVQDCVVDEARQVSIADGRILNDAVATKLYRTSLMLVDGMWKVYDNQLVERRDGVVACGELFSS
jgi:hypothetical protein